VANFSIPASTSGINSSRKIDFVNTRTSDGGKFEFKEGTSTTMTLKNSKVGVLTDDPDVEFHIVGNSSSTPFVYFEQPHSGGDFRWFFKNDELTVQRKSSGSYADVAMYLNYDGGDVIMAGAQVQGRLGINDTSPDCGLEVDTVVSVSIGTGQAYWYNGEQGHSSASRPLAIHAHGAVWSDNSTGFIVTSDRRIKKNIVDCSDALATLNQLQVKNYEYIVGNGNGNEGLSQPPTIGFIAQEVETVLPRAVSNQSGFIPNLYRETSNFTVSEDRILTINETFNSNRVRIYIHYNNGEVQSLKYEVNGGNRNKINNTNIQTIWLYGEEVSDYKQLKKSVIFSLNVKATQELYQRNVALEALVQSLSDRITALENN
jgi:hypothetical protein